MHGLISELSPEELLLPMPGDDCPATRQLASPLAPGRFTVKPRLDKRPRPRDGHHWSCRHRLRPSLPAGALTRPLAQLARAAAAWSPGSTGCVISLQLLRWGAIEVLGTTEQILTPSGRILGNRGCCETAGSLRLRPRRSKPCRRRPGSNRRRRRLPRFYGVAGIDALIFRDGDGAPPGAGDRSSSMPASPPHRGAGLLRQAEARMTRQMHAWAFL